ncbi:MAG: acyl-CoA synthetase [Planctomycetota bacterium]|jgi:acetyl-CoA synthetase/medium-chain acyl-CoA synthetase
MDAKHYLIDDELSVPERFNFARDVVDAHAADGEKMAIVWVGDEDTGRRYLTFLDIKHLSCRLANMLAEQGVAKGDRLFLMVGRRPEWWITMIALHRIGAVAVPATTMLTTKDITYRLGRCEIKAVVTDHEGEAKFEDVRRQVEVPALRLSIDTPAHDGWRTFGEIESHAKDHACCDTVAGDPALIYFTSGTTGMPKMVLHNQVSYGLAHAVTGLAWLGLTADDVQFTVSDTGWALASYAALYGPWHAGSTVVIDGGVRFCPRRTLEILETEQATSFLAAPTVYRLLVQEDLGRLSVPNLRSCASAGEPLNPEVMAMWEAATGVPIREGYGQTESVISVITRPEMEIKPGSMGQPSPSFDVRILDETMNEAPLHQEGDLAIRVKPHRPVGLFDGYLGDQTENARCFVGDYYLTGDRAYRDEDGYLWFVGRDDDVIISSGYRIGPFEVENALLEHPSVVEAAAVASPDKTRGSIVKAFIRLAAGCEPSAKLVEELQAHVRQTTAPYKYPRQIEFVNELPKTVSGKIRRAELRQREFAHSTSRRLQSVHGVEG